jgi:nitrite reductase/ring-hydroxylating ferredoxin subunit
MELEEKAPLPRSPIRLRLCRTDEVPEGTPHRVSIEGYDPFCVYRVEGSFYVTDDTCTHGKASLAEEGDLSGFKIVCSWHDGAYDIRTGAVLQRPCIAPLRAYPVELQDDAVCIIVPVPDSAQSDPTSPPLPG